MSWEIGDVERLYQAAGIEPATDLRIFALKLPDESAFLELAKHVAKLAAQRAGLSLEDAPVAADLARTMNAIITAHRDYRMETRVWPQPHTQLVRDLQRLAAHADPDVSAEPELARRLADPERRGEILAAFWGAAEEGRFLREIENNGVTSIEVKLKGRWRQVGGDTEAWVWALASDGPSFAAVAKRASETERRRHPRQDYLRPFRDLKRLPTPLRFQRILDREAVNDPDDLRIHESMMRFGVSRSGMFGGDVPGDCQERVGEDRAKIKTVGESVCDEFSLEMKPPGPAKDEPLEWYASRLCEVWHELTGTLISYATATAASRGRAEGERYGPGLQFMRLALRLVDPGATEHQARDHIDGYRSMVSGGKTRRQSRA
jgi:hypothetical protein